MRARWGLVFLVVFGVACGADEQAFVGELAAPVVYGADDRLEVYDHPSDELRQITRQSIVALIDSDQLERDPGGTYIIFSRSLQQSKGLCDDERFADQPTAATCSGVLIDDDLVLTAGHCVRSQTDCESKSYVFDYYLDGPTQLARIEDEDVYRCNQIVLREETFGDSLTPDFAVIQLDRPVAGDHQPAPVRPATTPLVEQEPLTMIGFGSGLPAKIDSGGTVADPRTATLDYFVANPDAFAGHSGSATFDSNNELAGILVAGRAPDYVLSSEEQCNRVETFDDIQAGEAIHYFAPIVSRLCAEGWGGDSLCEETSCNGEPCGIEPPPTNENIPGGRPVPAGSGCQVSQMSSRFGAIWAAAFLLVLLRRFRRSIV
ncbi:MAG: serine protease [Myxococcales bacterium]|nr:serine protease [Myxococcales bacterium]MDH3482934.1 serine protease [Myxococcales bacterium]